MQTNVLEYLEASEKRNPDKIAFADEKEQITFNELKDKAQRIGCKIYKDINKTNKPIAVIVNRDIYTIVAFMGVLYSGNFYVPIDKQMPKERMVNVLKQLDVECIICSKDDKCLVSEYKCKCITIEECKEEKIDKDILEKNRKSILSIDPVYIIFTSGSTGMPKGIVISHESVIDFIDWMEKECGIDESCIMGNQAPFYFDLSVKDVYLTLKCGATTHIISKKYFSFPILLIDFLNEKKINTLIWATSAFNLIANSGVFQKKIPKGIEKIILGGEALFGKNLNIWRKVLPNTKYINLYGPTEVTVDCTYYKINKEFEDSDAVPIGKSCENMQVLLLDENLKQVSRGKTGEICVRGVGIAKGYFNNKEKTDSVFIQNPMNPYFSDIVYRTGDYGRLDDEDNIVFSSRKDGQIKHMGYRIEIGEIERAINSISEIKIGICFYDEVNNKIICIYEGEISNAMIISKIKDIIPKYMFPNIIKQLEKIPYNQNGKVDRVKIKENYFNEINKNN